MDLTAANQVGNTNLLRDYRKGNWNLQETMVLIEAKKMDDERRTRRLGETTERGKPAELRWKWVEDYCWKNGCLRSQNQCNDKWDNLMRDFKKVREYERRTAAAGAGDEKSYWRIEKNERKDNNLPSGMLPQIYEALVGVVERKCQRTAGAGAGGGGGLSVCLPAVVVEKATGGRVLGDHQQLTVMMPPPAQQYSMAYHLPAAEAPGGAVPSPRDQPLPAVDSDTSEYSDPPAKRRKRRGGAGEGSSGGGAMQELGSAISKGASSIAEAIRSREEREEGRHKEVLSVHERRLQIEESKAEINREGINGLVDAINKLANSIFALAAHHNQSTSK